MGKRYADDAVSHPEIVAFVGKVAHVIERSSSGRIEFEDARQVLFMNLVERFDRYFKENRNMVSFAKQAITQSAANLWNPRKKLKQRIKLFQLDTEIPIPHSEGMFHDADDYSDENISLDIVEDRLDSEGRKILRMLRSGATYVECEKTLNVTWRRSRSVVSTVKELLS